VVAKRKGFVVSRKLLPEAGKPAPTQKLFAPVPPPEHKYPEALEIAHGLVPRYPQNLLIALEQGNLLRAPNNNSEAVSAYQKIWHSGRDGLYPDLHYELAALSLGDLLRAQKDYPGAASAYEQVNQIQKPDPEVLQKANLGAGEMYDVLKKRELALQNIRRWLRPM